MFLQYRDVISAVFIEDIPCIQVDSDRCSDSLSSARSVCISSDVDRVQCQSSIRNIQWPLYEKILDQESVSFSARTSRDTARFRNRSVGTLQKCFLLSHVRPSFYGPFPTFVSDKINSTLNVQAKAGGFASRIGFTLVHRREFAQNVMCFSRFRPSGSHDVSHSMALCIKPAIGTRLNHWMRFAVMVRACIQHGYVVWGQAGQARQSLIARRPAAAKQLGNFLFGEPPFRCALAAPAMILAIHIVFESVRGCLLFL
jgi:hypothetical protein